MTSNGTYRTASVLLVISAVLHVVAPFVSGFTHAGLLLAAVVPVPLIMIWGLARDWRWFAYLCFFFAAVGGIVALGHIWSPNSVPSWIYLGILTAEWLAAASLFVALWRSPSNAPVDQN